MAIRSRYSQASMATLIIPAPFRGPTQGLDQFEIPGPTVRDGLRAADERFPGIWALVVNDQQRLHPFVKLFVNQEPLEESPLDHPLSDSDTLEILAAIGGGR